MKCALAHGLLALALLGSSLAATTAPRLSLDARDSELTDVIRLLAVQSGVDIVPDESIKPHRVSIRLTNVSFDEALTTLREAYGLQTRRSGRIYIIGTAATISRRSPVAAESGGAVTGMLTATRATTAPAVETTTVALRNLRASDAVKLLKGALPDTSLIADDRQNTVVISGDAALAGRAHSLLAAIDNPGKQVMFEVRVADVQPVNDSSNVGLEFGGASYGAGALGQFPYTLTKSSIVVNAQLNALIQAGHASILAQPRIATMNNHEASLLVGETYPVVTVNLQTGFPSVTNIDVGVKLRLTPSIGSDGMITAEFHPEFSQITGFNATFPIVSNRRVDSTLRLHDGDTIVLGGLFSDIDAETITKFPILGDIPGLGTFFRNKERTHNRDEVVFYITPHIM